MNRRKKYFAKLRAKEIRRKLPTKAQKRNQMSIYLKNMAGYKHSQLKSKSYDEIQKLFDKEMKRLNTFVDMKLEVVKGSETRTEESSKRAGDELESDKSKKQKIDEHVKSKKDNDPEEEEMKKHIEILMEVQKDLRLVHLAMLYAIGLMTIWKHMGNHVVFKDGEWTVATSLRSSRNLIIKRWLSMKIRESLRQRGKPKRPRIEQLRRGLSPTKLPNARRRRKQCLCPLLCQTPSLILEPVNQPEEDTDQHLYNMKDTTEVNSLLSKHSPRRVSSSSGGSHCQAFPRRNRGGSGIGGSLQGDMDLHVPFVPAWNLTTYSILNDTESCRDMMINLATPAV
ncbi:hypothetical protein Tco_1396909 [Tanacetum coccineum]